MGLGTKPLAKEDVMDPLQFAAAMAKAAAMSDIVIHEDLEKGAKILKDSAQDAIGTYKFGWPPLGPDAVARHGDTPLLETGALKGSIEYEVGATDAWVGTNDYKAKWQEFGTSRGIPPRPVLGGAVTHEAGKIEELVVASAAKIFKP